jgi:hypothetical protein
MKFRGPVIIVEDILSLLGSMDKLKDDAEAIRKKMDIDDKLDEINKQYKKISEKIQELSSYPSAEDSAFAGVNNKLAEIKAQLQELLNARAAWENAAGDADRQADLQSKYDDVVANIRSFVNGGSVKTGWNDGDYDDEGNWIDGFWSDDFRESGLNSAINAGVNAVNAYKSKLTDLVNLCKTADDKKAELKRQVQELRAKLDSGSCSDELTSGMRPELDAYEDLLKYDTKPMAETMKSYDEPYIDEVKEILENVVYGRIDGNNESSDPRMSRANLASLGSNADFAIDATFNEYAPGDGGLLNDLAEIIAYRYTAPGGFKPFGDSHFNATRNPEFFGKLNEFFNNASGHNESEKTSAKNNITKIFDKAQDLFKGFACDPEGAKFYLTSSGDSGGGFGSEGDWGNEDEGKNKTKETLDSDIVSNAGNLLAQAADKVLLLTYDIGMFSNYTTGKRRDGDGDVAAEKTVAGIPLGKKVNYYYQSEQEYLYHGDMHSAEANLKAVAGLLLLVRFVFNYISTFMVNEVKTTVTAIKGAFAWAGPFGVVIGELARVGFALAEAALDVGRLRSGDKVALMKNNDTWKFGVRGLIDSAVGAIEGENGDDNTIPSLKYKDYMSVFLLFINGDDLAYRTAMLIQLNMTNYKEHVNADENAMSDKTLFDMSKARTDFKVTTTVDFRMLFLSMPWAQRGVNGTAPPASLTVSTSDYRGY